MRIIRPYGDSRSERGGEGSRRVLYDKSTSRARHEIGPFAHSHDELVIAQWISTIDKIATKPQGNAGATPAQRALRDKLGNAAWQHLIEDGRLQGGDDARLAYLRALWDFKIHPYGPRADRSPPPRGGRQMSEPSAKGRWYKVFAGDIPFEEVDLLQVAGRISKHLYAAEYRLKPGLPNRRSGKIAARAESIARNVLAVRERKAEWDEGDIAAYSRHGDVTRAIWDKAVKCEKDNGRVKLDLAAACLFDHWGTIFRDPETGAALGVEGARRSHPGLFALHTAVKETYTRLLKRHRKDTKDHRRKDSDERKVSDILPKDMAALLRLSNAQRANADLSALVRLGKVLHYSASGDNPDSPGAIDANWPGDVRGSRFWTSDGQAEIKRVEAFVRVWRHVLAYAGLTLKDWASFKGDILGSGRSADQAVSPGNFDSQSFDRKLELLFGNRAKIFASASDDDRKELLRSVIKSTAHLRHRAFHFKGRGMFIAGLTDMANGFSGDTLAQARALWDADAGERTARLKATLRAAHVEHFFDDRQNQIVLDLIAPQSGADLPLPRFSRILRRAENAWSDDKAIALPPPANRRALEAPARLCQYTVLKLLYERPFRSWLENRTAQALGCWIDRSVERATRATHELNFRNHETGRKVVTARAASLPKPAAGTGVRDFFFELSAATASEMRVQRGYESDGEKAREQAGYIDDLLCDALILALTDYIAESRLGWLLELPSDGPLSAEPISNIDTLPVPEADILADDWQVALYLVMHLLPVDAVGKLLHQLDKWTITAGRGAALPADEASLLHGLQTVLKLYLDMHDAKFEGGASLVGCTDFRALFETDAGFNRVFPSQLSPEADRRIPRRGLREIMRFGHLPLLLAVSPAAKILDATIDAVLHAEAMRDDGQSEIARWQKQREDLHEKWTHTKQTRWQ